MADIVLVNPRFEVSYWGLEHVLPLIGKRANLPTACLPLLAALTPPEHRVTVLDENVEPIDMQRLAQADIVGVTGMNVQRFRMHEILTELRHHGVLTAVGGPWVSVHEDYFADLADVLFVGEAEQTWPQFLRDWEAGDYQARYEQTERTDMTKVPLPRYDLLKMNHYLFGSVQFSRGCPFQCEFCDIIVTFGRRPRLKTSQQIIAELDALHKHNMEIAFIVDDNLIGNKRAIKSILCEIAAWQRANGYPISFFAEASLNLAEDDELMECMVDANIQALFVGIESPDDESLRETKKLQNVRAGRKLTDRVHRIQKAGLEVWGGMIVGFDHDDRTVFQAHRQFVREARVMHATVGMLSAIPKTPLYDRLAAAGRLDVDDESEFGTNVIPLLMSREEMTEGYVQLMEDLYSAESYFDRFEDLYVANSFRFGQSRERYWQRHPWCGLKAQIRNLVRTAAIYWQLMRGVPQSDLRRHYRRRLLRLLRVTWNPAVLFVFMVKCAAHYHYYTMTKQMVRRQTTVLNTF